MEFEGKTEKEAIDKAIEALGLERDEFDVEILENNKPGLFHKGSVKIRVHINAQNEEQNDLPVEEEEAADEEAPVESSVEMETSERLEPEGDFEIKLLNFVEELIEKIVMLEWKAFDKVENQGGRASCQDDWSTFSIMRKSQYMLWEEWYPEANKYIDSVPYIPKRAKMVQQWARDGKFFLVRIYSFAVNKLYYKLVKH